jgi:hypothetical protein
VRILKSAVFSFSVIVAPESALALSRADTSSASCYKNTSSFNGVLYFDI